MWYEKIAASAVFCLVFGMFFTSMASHKMDAIGPDAAGQATPTPSSRVATSEEIEQAYLEWSNSSHADTYDGGLGADTTCARCKSPKNWDPSQEIASMEALDCYSCKRVPGGERPVLDSGMQVSESDWLDIRCEICHIPIGDSYDTGIAFWDQAANQYQPVENTSELCAKCHEGQHGFMVVEEMGATDVHSAMACTMCHGNHGAISLCTDCHDPEIGAGAEMHTSHPTVNCTACHDQSGLSIWVDRTQESDHAGEYITRRFAHTLTSWPSHDLSLEVDCLKCHHQPSLKTPALTPQVSCEVCHIHKGGAVQFWCTDFPRSPSPYMNESDDAIIE